MRRNVFRVIYLSLFISCFTTLTLAQDVTVRGGFLQDSARLGDQLDYYLVARYPRQLQVLFPDSTFQFEPFEYASKRYFQTRTKESYSYDSTVYKFYTFDVSNIQYLALPVFSVSGLDSIQYDPPRDSIILISMIDDVVPDSTSAQNLPLKTNTLYRKVSFLLNYPILLIIAGSLCVIAILVWLIFGKRIRKYFRLKKLHKNHLKFMTAFSQLLTQLKNQFEAKKTETALFLWKKYLEELERKPYTKLTTRETIRMEKDEKLGESLQMLDKAIYGNYASVSAQLEHLQHIANIRFSKKIEEVKHG